MSGTSFLQKVFNKISLQKNEKIWLSSDDNRLEDRLRLLAEFPDTRFSAQLKLDSAANAKNGKLSAGLREKGNLCYAQGDSERALQVCQSCYCCCWICYCCRCRWSCYCCCCHWKFCCCYCYCCLCYCWL